MAGGRLDSGGGYEKGPPVSGSFIRRRLTLPLVGITGSVGKTTTREMVATALSAGYRVFKTPANHNSQIGVPLTLSKISREDQIGVLELGDGASRGRWRSSQRLRLWTWL